MFLVCYIRYLHQPSNRSEFGLYNLLFTNKKLFLLLLENNPHKIWYRIIVILYRSFDGESCFIWDTLINILVWRSIFKIYYLDLYIFIAFNIGFKTVSCFLRHEYLFIIWSKNVKHQNQILQLTRQYLIRHHYSII